jgi:hypothetical protein
MKTLYTSLPSMGEGGGGGEKEDLVPFPSILSR